MPSKQAKQIIQLVKEVDDAIQAAQKSIEAARAVMNTIHYLANHGGKTEKEEK